jgi:hypothetical protein
MATARSPAESIYKQRSIFVIFVVKMDNNAAHAASYDKQRMWMAHAN